MFVISDTHFDHENIIKYCDRPFSSLEEMDETMIENWNSAVSTQDVVLHLGDIAMARPEVALEYARRLNGQILMTRGNHDDLAAGDAPFPVVNSHYFTYEDLDFWCTHWPVREVEQDRREAPLYASPPDWFDGWVLHGHVHNNHVEEFPFVDPETKHINLSVEVTEYSPVSMETIVEAIRRGGRYETFKQM